MTVISFYLTNLLAVVFMMLLGWAVSVRRRNVTVVDTLWGLGFVLIAWLTWLRSDGYAFRQLLLCGLTTLWGLRLAIHLHQRNHGKAEDPRYADWRKAGGRWFWLTSLFKVFLLQALFLWVIALAVQAGQTSSRPDHPTVLDVAGMVVWLVGFFFESVGDWQLARFKADPANRGKILNKGLWRYSRHPNYFGESLIWWGIFLIALSDPRNGWTIVSPLLITLVLLKMTGVALTERIMLEKKPEYREYSEQTPAFFPWVPKRGKRSNAVNAGGAS